MKIISILILSLPLFITGYTQDSIQFNMQIKPLLNYHQTMKQNMDMTMTYGGDSSMLERLREKGIENPVKINRGLNMEIVTITGDTLPDGRFPIILKIISSTDGNGKITIPADTKILGTVTKGMMPVYDSVSGALNESFKKSLLQTMQKLMSQLVLPAQKMGIGQVYNQSVPINLPINGDNLLMTISISYTLTSISEDIAHFNLNLLISMNADSNKTSFTASGGGDGTGTLDYNIKYQYPQEISEEFIIDAVTRFNTFTLHLTLKSNTSSVYTIRDVK